MTRTRRPGGLCVLVLMALILVALPAVPARGDHSPPPSTPVAGTGNLQGTELAEDQAFLGHPCFAASKHIYGVRGEGTYHGRTAEGAEVIYRAELAEGQPLYEGPLHFEVENTEPFHHGPFGTHGSDSTCGSASVGTPVPAQFRICAPRPLIHTPIGQPVEECTAADNVYKLDAQGARLPCTGKGSFARVHMPDGKNWHADWALDADCVVVGNQAGIPGQGVAPAGTTHTHRGTHGPCGGTCVSNIKIDFAQFPPVPGLALSMVGPTSGGIGQPVTLTAIVADDGVPQPSAPVTFSVDGPGPGAPTGGTAVTGDDGRASFTFTAAVEGDYTVTASATVAEVNDGSGVGTSIRTASNTHAVRFSVPAPSMTLAALSRSVIEDPVAVTATLVDENNPVPGNPEHDPLPGVPVDFTVTVTGAGQATPASGIGVTDNNGRATFNFTGDRAGDYTVTASATYLGQEVTATHTVRLEIKTMSRVGAIEASPESPFQPGLPSAVIDPAGDYAYFGTSLLQLIKVDLTDFQRVGTIELGEGPRSAVIDRAGDFAYFGTSTKVIKVDLATFQPVGAITLAAGENTLTSAVIDPAGDYAYFGTLTVPGRIVKVDLNTFQRVGAITLPAGEDHLTSAVVDPGGSFAYFGTNRSPGKVVKVDLATFQRVGAITLPAGEGKLTSAVIDSTGHFAYFASSATQNPAKVVKVDLNTFQPSGAIDLPSNVPELTSAVIDPAGNFAYFGAVINDRTNIGSGSIFVHSLPSTDGVVKVDLDPFELAHVLPLAEGEENLTSAVIDPDGTHAYFGTFFRSADRNSADDFPSKVVKLSLTRPPNPALVATGDGPYATDYLTPVEVPARGVLANDTDTRVGNGDALTAHDASDPAGGSVTLRPDGSFTYTPDEAFSGTDTFTYVASDGIDYSAPATVSIEVRAAPEGVRGSAYGYLSDVALFGGASETRGPDPSVSMPLEGSSTPVSASAPSGSAVYGPATIFSSGPLTVSTEGTVAGGTVRSSASIDTINTSQSEVFTAGNVTSSCEATETGVGGETIITGGTLRTSEGDPNVEGDETVVEIPLKPDPNTVYEGQIETVGDRFEYIFNSQVINPDGSITVYAAHQRLLGPTAIGDLYIGKSECGITLGSGGGNTVPTATDDAYTTGRDTALEVPAPGVLANDSDADGDALTATSGSDPASGSVVLNADGSFTYTPDAGFVGTDTFTYTADDANGGTATATVSITVEAAAAIKARVADFDGDGDSDRSVFRKGAWYAEGQPAVFHGVSGDVPVPGDYNGDGTTDKAVYRKGAWYIEGQPTVFLGNASDIPVPGDYDGDGTTEAAVYRNGAWYVAGQAPVFMGNASDIPVPGDYDGDGKVDRAVYRNGAWYVHNQPTAYLGNATDIPVPGDYDGDGSTERAVYRKGAWYVDGQPTVFLGNASDIPVPGDYDADASTERGIWRPSVGGWYVEGQPNVFLGVNGDIPLPLPQAIYRARFLGPQ